MKIHPVYKKVGQTPLEALEKFRKAQKISAAAKLTYAGRLDPMAQGLLLILEGASQKQKEKYLALPKVYEAEVLFGFATDSYDILGLAKQCEHQPNLKDVKLRLLKYKGKVILPIPLFSSVPINSKASFVHAREGSKVKPLTRQMQIKQIKFLGNKTYSASALLKIISGKINKVNGDFRQEKILKQWRKLLKNNQHKYLSVSFSLSCSSGTYVRSLANDLGKGLGSLSVLFNLKRLSVGKYKKPAN